MIKLINSLLSLILAVNLSAQVCDITIAADDFVIDGETTSIPAGSMVCIESSQKDFLLIKNVHGTEDQPITFVNSNGQVLFDTDHFYGIKIANCSFIKFLGNGYEGIEYGFKIKRVANGSGMSIDELSTNIEVSKIEISNTLIAGLYAKTDPDCTFASSRDNFTMYSLHIHDCYFHDIGDEGMYIGHSKYEQGVFLDDCDTTIFPHLIKDVKVYNNILEHCGWDGIQVSSSDEDCSIYNNIIRYDSDKETLYQMSGILIGGGSRCDCYNNEIYDGKGDGIDVLGLGGFMVYNNLIVRAGRTFEPGNPNSTKHGIYVGDVVTFAELDYKLYNNTIVSPKSYGVTYNNPVANQGIIINNLIVDPGKIDEGESAYVNNLTSSANLTLNNNIFSATILDIGFNNPSSDDYSLKNGSIAIDFGKNLASEGITFDLLNHNRPYNTFYDVGAYEYQGPDAIDEAWNESINIGQAFPNPAENYTNINIKTLNSGICTFTIRSIDGKQLLEFNSYCQGGIYNKIEIDLRGLDAQLCILTINTGVYSINRKLIIQ
jgi:hypothetical protein